MKVTYNGPVAAVQLAATGDVVRAGQSIEVPDDIGAQLVEQGWTAGDTPAPKPKAPKPKAPKPKAPKPKAPKPTTTTTTTTTTQPADAGDTTEGS